MLDTLTFRLSGSGLSALFRGLLLGVSVALVLAVMPLAAFAGVEVSEIAWMGTAVSANDEWIELHNPDGASVEISGWTLSWATTGTSPKVVELSGAIAAGGYYLLERTDDETVPSVSADLIYVGALSNSGELLVLKNASGEEVARVDGADGWKIGGEPVKGDNSTKATAQLVGGVWITAAATPRVVNTNSPQGAGEGSEGGDADGDDLGGGNGDDSGSGGGDPDDSGDPDSGVTLSSGGSSGTISAHDSPVPLVDAPTTLPIVRASAGRKRIGSPHTPLSFTALAYDKANKLPTGVEYSWSFGDGATAVGRQTTHSYLFPGSYHVVLHVRQGELESVARTTVRITRPKIAVSGVGDGKDGSYVAITNKGADELNVAGWELRSGTQRFTFPRDTLFGPKETVIIPYRISEIAPGDGPLWLAYADGTEITGSAFRPAEPNKRAQVDVVTPVGAPMDAITASSTLAVSVVEEQKNGASGATQTSPGATVGSVNSPQAGEAADTKSPKEQLVAIHAQAGQLLLAAGVLREQEKLLAQPTPEATDSAAGQAEEVATTGAFLPQAGGGPLQESATIAGGDKEFDLAFPASPAPEATAGSALRLSSGQAGAPQADEGRRVITVERPPSFLSRLNDFIERFFGG